MIAPQQVLSAVVLQMCCSGRENVEINNILSLLGIQKRCLNHLQGLLPGGPEDTSLEPLKSQILSVSTLVDDYAVPNQVLVD